MMGVPTSLLKKKGGSTSAFSTLRILKMSNYSKLVSFRATKDFTDRLESLSARMQISKEEVFRVAIDTLELIEQMDRQGEGIVFMPNLPKVPSQWSLRGGEINEQ